MFRGCKGKGLLINTVTESSHLEAHGCRVIGCRHERLMVVRDKVEIIIGCELGDIGRRRKRFGAIVDEPACDIGIEGWRGVIKEFL